MTHLRRWLFWCYALAWTALLWVPSPPDVQLPEHADKVAHVTGYVILFLLAAVAYPSLSSRARGAALFAAAATHAAITETGQFWIPTRSSDLRDWIADIVGLALAWLLIVSIRRMRAAPREATRGDVTGEDKL